VCGGGIMTTIESHLRTEELEARYEAAGDAIAKSHFHALWLLSKGYDLDEVAELLWFSTRWVYQLVKRYNAGGPDCLGDQRAHNGTEPTIVTPQALSALKERIKTPPDDGGLWSGPKLARFVRQRFGVEVCPQTGWRWSKELGFRLVVPRPRHPKAATPEQQRRWL